MSQHTASVTVNAPVHQVYALFSHFNDYPKFMTFVREVTYLDDQRSHWVVDVVGTHSWDAANENWMPDQQIGWRSIDGLKNSGVVRFEAAGADRTKVTVVVEYEPPAGVLGNIAEVLGAGGQFERRLQHDLDHFAAMVAQAPPGALDPTSSSYLFHADSAAARGKTTRAQDESMGMSSERDRELTADDGSGLTESNSGASTAAVSGSTLEDEGLLSDPGVPRVPGTSERTDFR